MVRQPAEGESDADAQARGPSNVVEAREVDAARYTHRDYRRTQEIADAAFFLGFDGLIASSAWWTCLNLVLFTDRIPPDQIQVAEAPETPLSWEEWRKEHPDRPRF